ncbi:MAG: outer membrane protein assembly factor BamD [Campylobacterota bacterium]|nr:outer membrane protein assembly factor BamD [Campylobacterota bacterium]
MRKKLLSTALLSMSLYIFSGCASKDGQEYNKPAVYWYNKMIKQISNYQIDLADDTFTSLESEHRNSKLLPAAMLIIANAHIEEEEYLMANYYFDEYIKKFSLKENVDYIRYLKIKSNFLAFKSQFREQDLLMKTLNETSRFTKEYPNSQYIYLVKTIQSRLLMSKSVFDKEISELYARVDKPKAENYYNEKALESWSELENIQRVSVPWYRYIFE